MAIICTNFLTGNDTTGNGSTGAPYKTIMKGLTGATSGDEIRVAGGQWTAITGTVNFTQGLNTASTTTDLRAQLAAKDILTFDDGEFGFDKFHMRISSITANTITWTNNWAGPTITTSALYKLNAYHYDVTTSNNGIEFFDSASLLPNGRTGVKIVGGWDSGYTSNANGWTVYRSTTSGALFGGGTAPGPGVWNDNLVFDKFLISAPSAAGLISGVAGSAGTGASFAVKDIAIEGTSAAVVRSGSIQFACGIWNPPGEECNFYLTGQVNGSGSGVNVYSGALTYGGTAAIPVETKYNLWSTNSSNNSDAAFVTSPAPFQILPWVQNIVGVEGAVFKGRQIHWRSVPVANVSGNTAISSSVAQYSSYIENLTLYATQKAMAYSIPSFQGTVRGGTQIFSVGYTGAFASKSGLTYGSQTMQNLVKLTGSTIESTRPCFGSNNGATAANVDTAFSKVCQSYLAPTQVEDSEGLKTLDIFNNIYFKDPVNNWLKITASRISAPAGQTGGFKSWSVLGVLDRPTTPFTVSVTLKVDGGTWDQIAVQYGPQTSQIVTQSITPTSSFATYTLSVDPTAIADWSSFIFPIYIGIRSTMPNLFYEEPNIYCYVQSLSIV